MHYSSGTSLRAISKAKYALCHLLGNLCIKSNYFFLFSIDGSFRRPGRLEIEIELSVPDFQQRISIVQAILDRSRGSLETSRLNEEDVEYLCRNAHGYVGADLEAVLAQVWIFISFDFLQLLK